jgi:hypothetical protein
MNTYVAIVTTCMAAAAAYNESRGTSSKVVRYNNTILSLEKVRSSFETIIIIVIVTFIIIVIAIFTFILKYLMLSGCTYPRDAAGAHQLGQLVSPGKIASSSHSSG